MWLTSLFFCSLFFICVILGVYSIIENIVKYGFYYIKYIMKKYFLILLVGVMSFSIIPFNVSANFENSNENMSFENELSETLIEKVDPHVKSNGYSYELFNLDKLERKISKSDLIKVEKKIVEINLLLEKNNEIEKVSNNIFEVEMTDEELKRRSENLGYDNFKLDESIDYSNDYQNYYAKSTKNGINKVKFYWWGYKLWLSKTSVGNILSGGVSAAALVLGILIPGVGIAIALAVNAYIWGIFANQKARAIYFKYNLLTGISDFKYQ